MSGWCWAVGVLGLFIGANLGVLIMCLFQLCTRGNVRREALEEALEAVRGQVRAEREWIDYLREHRGDSREIELFCHVQSGGVEAMKAISVLLGRDYDDDPMEQRLC